MIMKEVKILASKSTVVTVDGTPAIKSETVVIDAMIDPAAIIAFYVDPNNESVVIIHFHDGSPPLHILEWSYEEIKEYFNSLENM